MTEGIKMKLFQATVESVLLYVCEILMERHSFSSRILPSVGSIIF